MNQLINLSRVKFCNTATMPTAKSTLTQALRLDNGIEARRRRRQDRRRVAAQLAEGRFEHRVASRSSTGTGSVRFDWSFPQALDGVSVAEPLSIILPFLQRALEKSVMRFVPLSASALDDRPLMSAVHGWLRLHVPSWFMHHVVLTGSRR